MQLAGVATATSIGRVYLIGLTGGIASGKSVVAGRLQKLGAVLVDADQLAREVVAAGTPVLAAIVDAFGTGMLLADGILDRARLAGVVFADPQARITLNEITHPAIQALAARRIAESVERNPEAVVVYDVPLLVEAARPPGHPPFDLVVVVQAQAATRLARLIESRGLSGEEALKRINAQATDLQRLTIADVVIDSDGTLDQTLAQADALWAGLPGPR